MTSVSIDKERILLLKEMTEEFHGKWLAIEVTDRDKNGQPKAGRIISSSSNRLEVREKVKDLKEVCILYAGNIVPEGYGVLF